MLSKTDLQENLRKCIADITFTKVDGTERKMSCTLMNDYLPEFISSPLSEGRKENDGILAVWDLEKNSWRSFRLDSIINIDYIGIERV